MKKLKLCIISIYFLALPFSVSYGSVVNGSIISDTAGIKVIKVWGNHYERGLAQGYLLAENIKDIYTGYMLPFMGKYLEAIKEHIRIEKVMRIDHSFHEEARGMIDGMQKAGVVLDDFDTYNILLSNAFLDLLGISSLKELRELRKKLGCSSLISWGEATKKTHLKGKSVITRHLDWPVHDNVINNQVIVIHNPSELNEQKWLMIGFAGQISVLSGLNEKGISVFLHMLNDYDEDKIPLPTEPFEPLSFTLRKALEIKDFNKDGLNSIDDVIAAINVNKHGYAEGFIVSMTSATKKGDIPTAAIAELAPTPPHIIIRCTDYPDLINGSNLYTANFSVKRLHKNNYCKRYAGVAKAVGKGSEMSADKCWDIMKNFSSLENNIQFMQYIPENKTLKIAVYKDNRPAFEQKPNIINLKYLLR